MQQRWIIGVAVLGGAALGGIAIVASGGGGARPAVAQTVTTTATGPATGVVAKTITVEASGSVKGKPDVATIHFGVQVDKPTAAEALNETSTKARSLIDLLKGQGIAEADLTTDELSLWPRTDNEGRQILGYTASNGVSATIRDLAKAGSIVDAATQAVGDSIRLGGVSFSISDTTGYAAKAREQAVLQAKAQAEQLAKAAGVGVGAVQQVATVSFDLPKPQFVEATAAGAHDSVAAPIQPGTQEIQARVTVVFELTA